MATFIAIGYGDEAGYKRTPPEVCDAGGARSGEGDADSFRRSVAPASVPQETRRGTLCGVDRWLNWQRKQMLRRPVVSAVVIGLVWGLVLGTVNVLLGSGDHAAFSYVFATVFGIAVIGSASVWTVRRAGR